MSVAVDVINAWMADRDAHLKHLMYGTARPPIATLTDSWNGSTTDQHELAVENMILGMVRNAITIAEAEKESNA